MTRSDASILVVEDENIVSKDIQARLKGMGYSVCGAVPTGEEAVEKALELAPDLVLMDIMLRGTINGTEAAERIRKRSDIPVVYLTAYSDGETLDRAKVTEPCGYVLKPFDDRDLHAAIEMALYRSRMERKLKAAEAELEAQRLLRIRADHLQSLGEMSAGVAHELSQPLVGVRGLAEHVVVGLDRGWSLTDDVLRERMNTIMEQADRMTHIIDHVRMFAREAGKPELSEVRLNDVVRSAVELTAAQFRSHDIDLEIDLGEGLPVIQANAYSLEEVLLNLFSNARDSVEDRVARDSNGERGKVRVWTGLIGEGPDASLELVVADNGLGIPADRLDRVFDPFFTTKDPDKGTGLGLSASKGIVEEFGGTIEVRSEPGGETAFRVRLPVRTHP